jgi:hypothetical protein
MSANINLDKIRGAALDKVERSEKNYKMAFFAAAMLEAMFLLGFILLMDVSNRLHLLVLIASIGIYSIIGLGLVALGAHVTRNTQMILKAITLSDKNDSPQK